MGGLKIFSGEMQMSEIKGKVVVISGASSGIGEATARLLAQKGAHVVVGARRTERLIALVEAIRAEGGSAQYRTLDVTSREDVESFVRFAQSEFGRVDVIINNAGVMLLSVLEALKVDEWNQTKALVLSSRFSGPIYFLALSYKGHSSRSFRLRIFPDGFFGKRS